MKKNILYGVFISFSLVVIAMLVLLYYPRTVTTISTQSLSNAEYDTLSYELVEVMKKSDPRMAIYELKRRSNADPRVERACHELLHELGRATLGQYKNDFGQAMSYQDEYCISGYIHGVIEEYFKAVNDVDVVMRTACVNYAPNSFMEWECYHGIGHGLMFFSRNDVPRSLAHCMTYKEERIASACANGVYMENFNADDRIHTSTYVKHDDPFYPCNTDVPSKGDCYMNAPIYYLSLNPEAYPDALHWCVAAPEESDMCAYGVGAQATRRNVSNTELLIHVCESAPITLRASCVSGVANGLVSHYHSRLQALQLCAQMDLLNRPICKSAAEAALI